MNKGMYELELLCVKYVPILIALGVCHIELLLIFIVKQSITL